MHAKGWQGGVQAGEEMMFTKRHERIDQTVQMTEGDFTAQDRRVLSATN